MASKEALITVTMMILITYTISLSLVSQVYPTGQVTKTFSNTGAIQIQTTSGIGVYSNLQCTTPVSSLPWGTLSPGDSASITFYIKNEGNADSTLSLVVDNWSSSSAEYYLEVSWDYNGASIAPDQTVAITMTLSVDQNIQDVDTFSFDITIVGTT